MWDENTYPFSNLNVADGPFIYINTSPLEIYFDSLSAKICEISARTVWISTDTPVEATSAAGH